MSLDNGLQELYEKRDKIKNKIEIEKAERTHLGARGSVQDVRISQEREKRLKDELNEVNEQIAKLEFKPTDGMVPLGGNTQKDFIKGIDEKAIINNIVEGFGLNPNRSQNVEVTTTTKVKVTDDLGEGFQNVQEYSNETTEQLKFQQGNKVAHDKNAQIEFILKELKDGVEMSRAAKKINVSLNDVNKWLNDGKNGRGMENIGFYNEVKQLETSSTSDEITINAKKVDDLKKPKTPRTSKNNSNKGSGSQKINNSNINRIENNQIKTMGIVLKCLKKGNTYNQAAKKANINPNLIAKWRKDGVNKVNENTIYFYNEIRKIESEKIGNSIKSNIKKNSKSELKKSKYLKKRQEHNKHVSDWKNKFVNPNDSPYVSRGKIKDSKFVQPNENFTINQTENNPKINHEINSSSKRDMKNIIYYMKRGNDRKDACKKANVNYNLFLQWYTNGLKNRNKETRYFLKQIKKIEQKNKQKVNYIYNNNPNDKNESTEEKPSISITPVTSIPNIQPYSKDISKTTINFINYKPENFPKEMEQIISFMRQGDSRKLAARKSNVSIEQLLRWYGQGSNDYSPDTTYFYQQLRKIEQQNKKPSKTYNFIPKNKQKNKNN